MRRLWVARAAGLALAVTVLGTASEDWSSVWLCGLSQCSIRTLARASSASIGVRGWGGSSGRFRRARANEGRSNHWR